MGEPRMRISDTDRDSAVRELQRASAEGLISLEEFSDRSKLAYRAQYQDELQALFRDLPAVSDPDRPTAKKRTWLVHVFGASNRTGEWKPGQPITALSILSTQTIDLSEATTSHIAVTAFSVLGKTELIVRPGTVVDISGFTLIGGIKDQLTQRAKAQTTVAVRAWGFVGRCVVRNPNRPSRPASPPPPP